MRFQKLHFVALTHLKYAYNQYGLQRTNPSEVEVLRISYGDSFIVRLAVMTFFGLIMLFTRTCSTVKIVYHYKMVDFRHRVDFFEQHIV